MSTDQIPAPAPPGVRFDRSVIKPVAVLVTVVVFAVATGLGVRWWTRPDLFGSAGGDVTMSWGAQPLAKSRVTFAVGFPRRGTAPATIRFRSAPVMEFAENTARASVTFGICHPANGPHGVTIGSVQGSGRRFCTRLDPIVHGTSFRFGTSAYILATVTPSQRGRVVMVGADFDYSTDRSHWYRRGVDHLSLQVVMKRIY